MPYIDTKHLFQCQTCKHHNKSGCATFCDHGEQYIPDMKNIPEAKVIEVACLCGECEWYNESRGVCYRNSWDDDRVDFVEATDGCKHGEKKE